MISRVFQESHWQHVLLMGVPAQSGLLCPALRSSALMAPWGRQGVQHSTRIDWIESDFSCPLPILSGSLDAVILPHTLEWLEDPQVFFSAVCTLLKPEGELIILGFNPLSTWGLKKNKPRSNVLISPTVIRQWLEEADFDLVKKELLLFSPPFMKKNKWLEWIGRYCCRPLGGVYCVRAKAKVIPLTPISLKWPEESISLSRAPSMSRVHHE